MLTVEALKAATRRLVKACGGQEACALIPGIGRERHQYFSEAGSIAHPKVLLRWNEVALMEADCGQPILTDFMARLTDHRLVPLPAIVRSRNPLGKITGEAMKETSEVFARLGKFLDDGVLSAAEGKSLDREIDQAIVKLMALRAQVDFEAGRDEE